MTDIKAFSKKNGSLAYHYFTPQTLTPEEVEQDLKEWGVDRETHTIEVAYE